jgi:inner membrane protein
MDPVSQGALGAALAASTPARQRVATAAALGALAGMAPDLDVLIRSATDPLLFLEYHRQFTHAIAFAPLGALACATLLHGLVRRRLRFRATYAFCLLGYATHGLLDACTSYGTQLLWPFSDARFAWNLIAVVDPAFTLPLLALLAAAVVRRRPELARAALGWAVLYLGLGMVQEWRAERAGALLAESRGHVPERLLAKPSFANLLVWKTVYAADGWYYVDAVRAGRQATYFPGERIRQLDIGRALPWLDPRSRQAADLERFRRFSDGYLAPAPHRADAVIDVRYSLVPNEIDPLWGIAVDRQRQDVHAEFFTDRTATQAERSAFLQMLGNPGRSLGSGAPEALRGGH